jgi:alpha-1,3-mannosyltransferase
MQRFAPYARRVARIDNAIDFQTFAAIERKPIAGRLITVGRLAENKNLRGLLNVFSAAYRLCPDLTLVIVGDGPERGQAEGLITELGINKVVIWLGFVGEAELLAELGKAEVFLSAARYEGFGLALLEAMAAGVIPVVNAIEAFEALVTGGQNGLLIDYDQVELAGQQLAEALGLPETEKRRLSSEAKQQAKKYSWDAVTPKFEKVYQQALSVTKKHP